MECGFTFIEVLISVIVLGITAIALFSGLACGFAILTTTRQNLRATQILTQKSEAIRLLTWDQLSECPTVFQDYYYPVGVTNNAEGTIYGGTISATGVATNIPDTVSYKSQIHLVTITVVWTNYIGSIPVVHTRQTQTLVAVNGIHNYIWGAQ